MASLRRTRSRSKSGAAGDRTADLGDAGSFGLIDGSVGEFFKTGVRVSLSRPGQALEFVRIVRRQAAAARTRKAWRRQGIPAPPIVILSITHRCNLHCAGCYAFAVQGGVGADPPEGNAATRDELSSERMESIVAEAAELGVSFFVIAGGEPFMRPEILDIARRFPRIVFLVFTNGLLLDEAMVQRLARLKNVVCLLSQEGEAAETDRRRGEGTHARIEETMARLRQKRLFFGCAVTLSRENMGTVLTDSYVDGLVQAGARFMLFVEYTPVDADTEDWALTAADRALVPGRMRELRKRHPALFIAVPWDEEDVGGCLAAGRGFVHISASGYVEPCPFAPYSDADLTEVSLREALVSPFLAGLRGMPHLLRPTGAGCALWKNRDEVQKVLAEVGKSGL